MKIVSQTADTMVLKEGVFLRVVSGILFFTIGIIVVFLTLNTVGFISGGALILLGTWLILHACRVEIIISKQINQISFKRKCIIGAKIAVYVLSDAVSVNLLRGETTSASLQYYKAQTMITIQSFIIFKNEDKLMLEYKKTSGHLADSAFLVSGRDKKTTTAKRVSSFIGIPFKETLPPGIIDLNKVTFLPHWLGGPKRQ